MPVHTGSYARVADLPVTIESWETEGLRLEVSSGFLRRTTMVALHGEGQVGRGEDVGYDPEDQLAFQRWAGRPAMRGRFTVEELSQLFDSLELFGDPPRHEASRDYRRWAFESAALDLALRQTGHSLAAVLGREVRPLRFVTSMRIEDRSAREHWRWLREHDPALGFKLDPTGAWDDALIDELARSGVVAVLDFKGAYHGTPVDQAPDPALYRRVAEAFPDAWLEDPAWTPETATVLEAHHDRITWDAPIHSLEDVDALPFPPRCLNVKPSRFGTWRRLLDFHDTCSARGIELYGGGQFELGVGRSQVQLLAALYHPDGSNDVAPGAYHSSKPTEALPSSPLSLTPATTGFRTAE